MCATKQRVEAVRAARKTSNTVNFISSTYESVNINALVFASSTEDELVESYSANVTALFKELETTCKKYRDFVEAQQERKETIDLTLKSQGQADSFFGIPKVSKAKRSTKEPKSQTNQLSNRLTGLILKL